MHLAVVFTAYNRSDALREGPAGCALAEQISMHDCGWGFEDSDPVIRSQYRGVFRKATRLATSLFYRWYRENSCDNRSRYGLPLERALRSHGFRAFSGIGQVP